MNSKTPRFKQIRTKLKLSQQEFADYLTNKCHIKTAKSTIGRYEAGIVYPSKRSLEKYALALSVSTYYLSGNGPTEEEVPDKIIKTLKAVYFQQKNRAEYNLKNNIQLWINFCQKQAATSSNDDKASNAFWKTYFGFLLTNDTLKNSLVGTTDTEFLELVNVAINTNLNEKILSDSLSMLVKEVNSSISDLTISVSDHDASKEEVLQAIKQSIELLEKMEKSVEKSSNN